MTRARWLSVVALAACGRLDFDPGTSVPSDTIETQRMYPCPVAQTAPSTILLSGQTFFFTSFDNTRAAIGSAEVTVRDRDTDTVIATATSDEAGQYSVSVPTGGTPRAVSVSYSAANYLPTTNYPDVPADRDTALSSSVVFSPLVDGAMWGGGQLGAVYGAAGTSMLAGAGTINVFVSTCGGQPIEGVVVELDPAPPLFTYLRDDGYPDASLTTTTSNYGAGVAYRAPAQATRVTARKDGLVFFDQTVSVIPDGMTQVIARPVE